MISHDNSCNLVLSDCEERIIREPDDDEASAVEKLVGSQLVRGDTVVVVGLVDEQLDEEIDWTRVRGMVIGSTKH